METLNGIEGVVVAAGFSSRAGGWKMAFDIGGVTVIERLILGMVPFCSRIIVVGGYHFELLKRLLPKQKYPAVELIYHDDYPKGMFSSVLAGFRQVRAPRFFFIPGDYPLVSSDVYQMLLMREGEIIIPCYQGTTGHPLLFQTKRIEDLFAVPSNYSILREFVVSHKPIIVEVADPGITMDLDTWDDYLNAIHYFETGALEITGPSLNP